MKKTMMRGAAMVSMTALLGGCAVWPNIANPDAVPSEKRLCENRDDTNNLASVRKCATSLRDTLIQLTESGADYDRATTYALFAAGTAAGVALALDGPKDLVKGIAIGAASILGFREAVNIKEQRRIYTAGIKALSCALQYDDELATTKALFTEATDVANSAAPAPGGAPPAPNTTLEGRKNLLSQKFFKAPQFRPQDNAAPAPSGAKRPFVAEPRSLLRTLSAPSAPAPSFTTLGANSARPGTNAAPNPPAAAGGAVDVHTLAYAANFDTMVRLAAQTRDRALAEANEPRRLAMLKDATLSIRMEMIRSLADSVNPENFYNDQRQRTVKATSDVLELRTTMRNNEMRLPASPVPEGNADAAAVQDEGNAIVEQATVASEAQRTYADCLALVTQPAR